MWVYDNSNLNESYSGLTTPLTFSFASRVYRRVYLQFCGILGVSPKTLDSNQDIFADLVSFIGGSMYYNLTSWHQMMLLLPGYSHTGRYLEEMMGIDEKQRGKITVSPHQINDIFTTLRLSLRTVFLFIFMKFLIGRFNHDFEIKYHAVNSDLQSAAGKDLKTAMSAYRRAEADLTADFKTPIVNDFAVMIGVGILRQVLKHSPDPDAINTIVSGLPGIKSGEPGRALESLVSGFRKYPDLVTKVDGAAPSEIHRLIRTDRRYAGLNRMINSYIAGYGHRIPGELKLESLSFQDNPETLVSIICQALKNSPPATSTPVGNGNPSAFSAGRPDWLRSVLLRPLIGWVRISISRREDTRFKRTLIFGVARDFFRKLGRNLFQSKWLESPEDIFWLTIGDLENPDNISNFKKIVQGEKRRRRFYSGLNLPSRIQSPTKVIPDGILKTISKRLATATNRRIVGTVAGRGNYHHHVEGEALVVKKFNPDLNYVNKILIAPQTDPGWTIIFPLVRAIVVDRGGILSHAAIVSREFGKPCIVGAAGATSEISTGQKISLDLTSGTIKIV